MFPPILTVLNRGYTVLILIKDRQYKGEHPKSYMQLETSAHPEGSREPQLILGSNKG